MKKQFFLICVLCMLVFSCTSCKLNQEVILEHSTVTDSDEETQAQTECDSADDLTEDDTSDDRIYVYICGQVEHPGVYQLAADQRVYALIDLAGGLTNQADETCVNQAQTLTDGQMIYIPAVGEEGLKVSDSSSETIQTGDGKVNINTADLATLMSLPGIGEGKAQSILNYRQEHGSFESVEDIMNVEGIKEGTYTKLKDKITV